LQVFLVFSTNLLVCQRMTSYRRHHPAAPGSPDPLARNKQFLLLNATSLQWVGSIVLIYAIHTHKFQLSLKTQMEYFGHSGKGKEVPVLIKSTQRQIDKIFKPVSLCGGTIYDDPPHPRCKFCQVGVYILG
jgi:hypothetical protein